MNYKKVNWYFLGVIMLHLAVVGGLIALQNVYQMGMAVNLLVSELILAVPGDCPACFQRKTEPGAGIS